MVLPNAEPRPELDRLSEYVEAMRRAWEHEVPTMDALAELGGLPRMLLQEVVQEYCERAVSYSEEIQGMLARHHGIAALPVIRSLYETHVTLVYFSMRNAKDRMLKAQVAFAHHPFQVLWEIKNGLPDPDGRMRTEAEEAIAQNRLDMSPVALEMARHRASRNRSWTGRSISQLVKRYGRADEYFEIYGLLSLLSHGHQTLISRTILEWTPQEYERYARNSHCRLRDIRMRMQDILNLRFSDAAIDSYSLGNNMLVHLPHASFKVPRP